MNQPAKPRKVSFFSKLTQNNQLGKNKSGQSTPQLDGSEEMQGTDLAPAAVSSDRPLATAWSEALACEARNSLQVVLSGAEILLEDHWQNLQSEQKALLSKMMDNTYHLCNLMASLLGPDEFKLKQISEDEIVQIRRVMGKMVN